MFSGISSMVLDGTCDAPFFCFFIGAKLPKEKEALKLISSQPKMTFLSAKNEISIAKDDTTVG